LFFPYILTLLRAPEGEVVPEANITRFILIIIGIGFYVTVLGWMSERVLRLQSEKFSGRRVMVGTLDAGYGRSEEFEFLVYEMFAYESLSEYDKEGVEAVEEEMEKIEVELKT